jgi:hypothetical protein
VVRLKTGYYFLKRPKDDLTLTTFDFVNYRTAYKDIQLSLRIRLKKFELLQIYRFCCTCWYHVLIPFHA